MAMADTITVAGLDGSLSNWGWARMRLDLGTLELEALSIGTIVTEPRKGKVVRQTSDDLRRCRDIVEGLKTVLEGCSIAFAEVPHGAQSARAAFSNGVVTMGLAGIAVPVIEVAATETKLASVGRRNAGKAEIISWAAGLYPGLPWDRYTRDVIRAAGEGTPPRKIRQAGELHEGNEHMADAAAVVHAGIRTPEFQGFLAVARPRAA